MYGSGCGYGSSGRAAYSNAQSGSAASYGISGGLSIAVNAAYGGSGHAADGNLYAHSDDSQLEAIAQRDARDARSESVEKPARALPHYVPSSAKGAYLNAHTPHDYFIADQFLIPGSTARFVGDAAEIREDIENAFRATTGHELPKDIMITVLNDPEFKQAHLGHNGAWNDGVQGFSLNSNGRGINPVFVRAAPLDRLMLTIGHEIGHVLTPSLRNAHDEEAKAFAFSLAWMDAIREKNIAGLRQNILPTPAQNGLHDRAFAFVQHVIETGVAAWDAFLQLAHGTLTITEQPIRVEV